jgi:hypothetical protein
MSKSWCLLLGAAFLSACSGGSGVPRHFAVPQGAENPIVIEYSGATVAQVTNMVAKVCADVPISTAQVRPNDGYLETRWSDIGSLNLGSQAEMLPAHERSVIYAIQAKGGENEGVLQIAGFYQPSRPTGTPARRDSRYDRLIPTGHPGYQLALQLDHRIKREFTANGITFSGQEQEEGQ